MQGALVKIFSYSVRTSNSGRIEMTTRYHMEFGVSEQGWEVFEKLQNLWGAACCCSVCKMLLGQAVVWKAVGLLKGA